MDNSYQHLLPGLLETAKEAGEAILEIYDSEFAVEQKQDKSPLTEADKRSHQIITHHLSQIKLKNSRLPILSEEGRDIPYEERKKWEYFWLVDPLDGTKEFIKRNGEFTINIALIKNENPVLGVIYIPVKDLFYFAAKGIGSYKLSQSEKIYSECSIEQLCRSAQKLPIAGQELEGSQINSHFTIIGSRSHGTKELEEFVEEKKRQYGQIHFISAGSSLKFCFVAEGRADIYPRYGPTMEWDTGAGHIIVEEAGGTVSRVDTGNPLEYNKENLLNPWFIVRKN